MSVALSIIVPCLNEASTIEATLAALQPMRARNVEVVVVDGGSSDRTAELAHAHCDAVLHAPRGRARQMNHGARHASGDVLLFLHADTRLPLGADQLVLAALQRTRRIWGRFDVAIAGRHWLLPVIATLMNVRSRATGIATGDQALFVTRTGFQHAGGFADVPLMEDIDLSTRLCAISRPACLREKVVTAGRRWEAAGVFRTIFLMWRLRFAYWLGADPAALAVRYDHRR